jgi:DNA-binding transcriptional ArsR family regulator
MTDLLGIVAQPQRQRILRLVWDRERSAGDIAERMDVTFGAVSQHLRILREAGAVTMRADGRHRFYRADRKALGPLAAHLSAVWRSQLQAFGRPRIHADER